MEVIALQGRGDCGKSYTINNLYIHLLDNGFVQVPGHFTDLGGHYDFMDVLTLNGNDLIGIIARGDIGSLLVTDLATLAAAGCKKVVCTCRTSGDTVVAVQHYLPHQFVRKTISGTPSQQRQANFDDVKMLYSLI